MTKTTPASADESPGTQERRRFDRGRLAVALALLSAPWIAFPPDFIPKALLDGGDDLLANLPELIYSGKRLLEGELFWAPELWMGHPLWGEPEFATFYLPKLMLLLGSPVVVYAAYLVLHYLAAEVGAYLYLKHLGIGRTGRVFGALAYAYAGFMLGHRAHTMYVCAGAWAPFVLLAFDRAADGGGPLRYLVAALAFSMLPFSGAIQLTVYLAGTILLLAGARSFFEHRRRPFLTAVVCLVPAVLVSALQLVPSRHFAQQLATDLRADYALDVMHSFHPALLPTLALPIPPLDGELYSRAGVVVLCAAAAALMGIRSAPPHIRAWAVVAAVAGFLMLGRYFPPLAHLLHGLPVVGVLRGPVRHNFEFGLALSVLGAYGLELAGRSGAGSIGRWIAAGAVFFLLSWGMVHLSTTGYVTDDQALTLIYGVTRTAFFATAVAFAIWLLALARRSRRGAASLWACVAVLPLLETAWAMRVESQPNHSALGVVEAARAALPEPRGFVRLLSVSLLRGSVDALAGNSVLFHPGVESLQGYSSIVYSDARQLLDLEMHGQPIVYDELAFSTLPSVFGVTHVVLPSTACGDVRLSLAPEQELCARTRAPGSTEPGEAAPPTLVSGELGCTALPTDTTWSYELEAGARAPADDALGASFIFIGGMVWDRRFGLDIPGPSLGPWTGPRHVERVRVSEGESWGGFSLQNDRTTPVEFVDAGLFADRDVALAVLSPLSAARLHAEHAEVSRDFIRLSPTTAVAGVERPVLWPRATRASGEGATLEVEARASSPAPKDLVVDLYADPGYDSEAAQMVIAGSELGPAWRFFKKDIRADDAPDEFLLRAFSVAGDPIEVREARLSARFHERVYECPIETNLYPRGAHVDGTRITLGPKIKMSTGVHLPVRAFDVLLDAEAETPLDGPVSFGLDLATRYDVPRVWQVAPDALKARARVHHVAILPPDVRDPRLFVRTSGAKPIRVNELSATDACALRDYRNPRRLANGLFLYENPRAAPRAYTVGVTVRRNNPTGVREALLDFAPADLGTKAVVTTDVPPDLGTGRVERADFGQRSCDIVVRSDEGPTLLVVNERFDPDWRATIDGAPTAIIPVNGLVRGVVVPKGSHRVHFEYRIPAAIWLGIALSIAGVLGALLVAPALHRHRWLGK